MAVLLVAYDNHSDQDRPEALGVIERYPWTRLSETTYAIASDESPEAICEELITHMCSGDQAYVVAVTGPYRGFYKGFGPEAVNDWLDEHFEGLEDHLDYYGR